MWRKVKEGVGSDEKMFQQSILVLKNSKPSLCFIHSVLKMLKNHTKQRINNSKSTLAKTTSDSFMHSGRWYEVKLSNVTA